VKTCQNRSSGTLVVLIAILSACAACAALLTQFAMPAEASGGRDFIGTYSLGEPTQLGDQVRLKFSARIFNSSDSEVAGVTVMLKGSAAPKAGFAAFYGITLRDRESVRLSQEITIPAREYKLWKAGHTPSLVVQYQGLSGQATSTVELRRGFVGEE